MADPALDAGAQPWLTVMATQGGVSAYNRYPDWRVARRPVIPVVQPVVVPPRPHIDGRREPVDRVSGKHPEATATAGSGGSPDGATTEGVT